MKVVNFGSLNYDYVYSVDHIVTPGETITSSAMQVFCGGKGLNQSVALSRAGVTVYHAGMVGDDGSALIEACEKNSVDTRYIRQVSERSGNAIIQVSGKGQNSIVLFSGANRQNTREFVDRVLSPLRAGDVILLQNEINLVDYIIERAYEKRLYIVLNPSPFDEAMRQCDLKKISLFLLNEVEGMQITGFPDASDILENMRIRYPSASVVLTLGKSGVVCLHENKVYRHGIYNVPVVDTTAAGDTFTGFFVAELLHKRPIAEVLQTASVAASIAVSRKGAASSIPYMQEVVTANLELLG
ncbi:MAG: ribokinase [Acetanaerobacterium sp.]